ncbi:MAG: HU family DNA-binding protein, partial [Patescibacteria group bacterium]
EAFTLTITDVLKAKGEVTITGFGTFMAKERSARAGVNPQNPSERIQIGAVTIPKFKSGKALKDALKGK